MKKILLSLTVIMLFVMYSFYERVFGYKALPIIVPKAISTNPSPTISTSIPTVTSPPTTPVSNGQVSQALTATQPPSPTPKPKNNSPYKDGTFVGDSEDAFYGLIQVQATISNGKITSVQFLQYPNDRGTSVAINSQADPLLSQEAIQAQSANVDIVSGATDSSQAFMQSLQTALNKAKS